MSDILIRGMEMPGHCFNCSTKINPDERRCNIDGHVFEETLSKLTSRRDDDCPLVELPPHGDLKDANKLLAEFERDERAADEHGREFSFSFESGGARCTEWWIVQQKLMDAPVIVPASEEVET